MDPTQNSAQEDKAYLELLENYIELTNYLQLVIDTQLKQHLNLRLSDYRVVRLLAEHKDQNHPKLLRMSDLASHLKVSSSRITYQITSLEKAGLAQRHTDETDRRSFQVAITDKGLETYQMALKIYHSNVRPLVFDNIRMAEIDTVNDIHSRLLASLGDHYSKNAYKIFSLPSSGQ